LYDKDGRLLLSKSQEYDTLSQKSDKDSYTYAIMNLLLNVPANLTVQNILSKCMYFNEIGNHDVCLLYLLYIKSKFNTSINWKQLGEDLLKKSKFQLAIFCFHAVKFSIQNWTQSLDLLTAQGQYSTVALMLTLINAIMHGNLGDMKEKANPVVSFLIQVLLSSHKTSADWINHTVVLMQQKSDHLRIIWCLVFIQAQFNIHWNKLKNDYYSCQQREAVVLCYKMEQIIDKNQNSLLTFARDIYPTDSALAMELLNVLNLEWKMLGDYYFQEKKYEQALNCYLKSQEDSYILVQASKCTEVDFNILFNIAVYHRKNADEHLLLTLVDHFYQLLPLSSETRKILLIEIVKRNQKPSSTNYQLFKFHLLLLTELAKDEKANDYATLMTGGLHFLNQYENLTSDSTLKLVELNKKNFIYMNTILY
jgi:hypothetical protein